MKRAWAMLMAMLGAASVTAADLTAAELRWLRAGLPVLTFARQQGLLVDVVVQPHAAAGQAPVAMDYVDGRCKLVLTLRGNPAAASSALSAAPPELHDVVIEAITAHEVAHCWRHAQGRWKVLPAGFVDASLPIDAATGSAWRAMRATRREEGYADLAGLAWTLRRHPGRYSQVHDWFVRVRDHEPVPGSHHDTRAWLRLAVDPAVFDAAANPFEQVQALWQQGLHTP